MRFLEDIYFVFRREFYLVFRDHGVLTFFVLLTLVYPLLYAYIYSNEIAEEVPVAVVDESHSALGREFVRNWDATVSVRVVARCGEMEEAKELMRKKEVYGVLWIPGEFSRQVARGEQAHVSLYCDMGALLNYKALLAAATDVSLQMGKEIQAEGLEYATDITEAIATQPVKVRDVKMFNPQGGYTSFLIPAVLILVIQQSLLLGVGMVAGTERDRRRNGRSSPAGGHFASPLRVVLGKACAYLPVYFVMGYWVFFIVPRIFNMTQIGGRAELMLFLFPFLLASVFLAIAVSFLSREREAPFLIFVFTSVPLMFISGISWPKSAIPDYLLWLGKLFPSTFGIDGFVKINNAGATLSEVLPEYAGLWILAAVYLCLACFLYYREMRMTKIEKKRVK